MFFRQVLIHQRPMILSYVMLCAIWYHLYNLKNVKNTHEGVLLSVKLQAEDCNFTKSNTPPWVFFTFFKLYKWYQIARSVIYRNQSTDLNILEIIILNELNLMTKKICLDGSCNVTAV